MLNGIFNRVVPQAFLTGLRRDGAASSAQAGVTHAHRVAQEEIFGPVLSVMTFRTPEEAVERANNTPYGLSAGVWTDKGSKIFKIVNQLRAGVVSVRRLLKSCAMPPASVPTASIFCA